MPQILPSFPLARVLLAASILIQVGCSTEEIDPDGGSLGADSGEALDASSDVARDTATGVDAGVDAPMPPRPSAAVTPSEFPDLGMTPTVEGNLVPLGGAQSGSALATYPVGEIVVMAESESEAQRVADRWNGRVVEVTDYGVEGAPMTFVLEVDSTMAPFEMFDALAEEAELAIGSHTDFSSDAAFGTFLITLFEGARHDVLATPNFLLESAATQEEIDLAAGVNFADTNKDNVLGSGGVHDTRVTDAWRLLAAKDRLKNKVMIMIADSGFLNEGQLPVRTRILGNYGVPNSGLCGSGTCPWHGTNVVAAAMGATDAPVTGPAAPVAELLISEANTASQMFNAISRVLRGPPADRPGVLNISLGSRIPALLAVFIVQLGDTIGQLAKANDVVVFTSAGNDSEDVDATDCFGACWEEALWFPCELEGFTCVGATESTRSVADLANYSNYGSERDGASTVEIFSIPGLVYGDSTDGESLQFGGREVASGTSFSSPFVAGVAALVRAANPGLNAAGVLACIFDSAHPSDLHDSGGYQRRINAFGAVACALGDDMSASVRILEPRDGQYVASNVELRAIAVDDDGVTESVEWFEGVFSLGSDRELVRASFGPGEHILIARSAHAETTVRIVVGNDAPRVRAFHPQPHHRVYAGENPVFLGTASDTPSLRYDQVCWMFPGSAPCGRVNAHDEEWFSTDEFEFSPGIVNYQMSGNDGLIDSRDSSSFRVLPLDPRNTPPTIEMGFISGAVLLNTEGSNPRIQLPTAYVVPTGTYRFSATATDAEDGVLDGRSLVWTVQNSDGTVEVICDGGQRDCSSFDADVLDRPGTYPTVTVEAMDSRGAIRQATLWVGPQITE